MSEDSNQTLYVTTMPTFTRQNATLAGGVIVGASADLMLQPYGALCAGCVAGSISTFGYQVIQVKKIRLGIYRLFLRK